MKTYKRGFYGGKFLPFHKGHKYCIEVAASQCEELVVIIFYNDETEQTIMASDDIVYDRTCLTVEHRREEIRKECRRYPNVRFAMLDCGAMHAEGAKKGLSDWDSETSYVLDTVGEFQAVYSSEEGYDAYFRRAYPWAKHEMIDCRRIKVPISGTKIRAMKYEEGERWI